MDLPYSQRQNARQKSRSAANLQHLSLAPLSSRLPLRDDFYESLPDQTLVNLPLVSVATPSYLYGRSAPATPRLLSRSPPPALSRSRSHEALRRSMTCRAGQSSRVRHSAHSAQNAHTEEAHGAYNRSLPKSRSTTHLAAATSTPAVGRRSGTASPLHSRHRRGAYPLSAGLGGFPSSASLGHYADDPDAQNDWLLRAGAIVTSETRESKGQSWLTARASSTSLAGLRGVLEETEAAALERELARERELSRQGSFPGSFPGSRTHSRLASRVHSRAQSRTGSYVQLYTPRGEGRRSLDGHGGYGGHGGHGGHGSSATGYFDGVNVALSEEQLPERDVDAAQAEEAGLYDGPDFVNLDEQLESVDWDASLEDEDHVRRLVRREKSGGGVMGSWLGSVFGWSLFSLYEDGEDGEDDGVDDGVDHDSNDEGSNGFDDDDDDGVDAGRPSSQAFLKRSRHRVRSFEGAASALSDHAVPPPPKADEGGWQDAAWLLSVASNVLL